jgi:hypothetical protein
MIIFRKGYAAAAAGVFAAELFIAVALHDRVVRPYGGDSLAVALVYCLLRSALALSAAGAAMLAFAIACTIELGQLFGVVDLLGLGGSAVARTVLGTGFDPADFAAYALGAAAALIFEATRARTTRRARL